MTTNDDQAVNIFAAIGAAMSSGGYADFTEFMNTAVASGFHDDENIDVAGFIAAGAPRPTQKEETMTKETEPNQHGDIVPSFHYSQDPGVIYANDVPVLDLPTLDAADDGYPERIITLAKDFVIDEHRGMDGETLSYTAVNDVFYPMHLQARTLKELLVRIVHTAYGLAAHEEFVFDMERIKREEDAQ